jgi:myo-inositol-1(or 4)-monophosphatase
MQDVSQDMQLAIKAAMAAGDLIVEMFSSDIKFERKGEMKGLVSDTDILAEKEIIQILNASGYTILGEESKSTTDPNELYWIIDALDGTTNFVRNLPLFGVSLALMSRYDVLLGVIYNPWTKECYYAERGKGAFLNGNPIQIAKSLSSAASILFINHGYDFADRERYALLADRLAVEYSVRTLGSTALELCYVAKGVADAFICSGDELWDFAAGILIVCEAGGKLTDWKGYPWNGSHSFVFASNGAIHKTVVPMIQDLQPIDYSKPKYNRTSAVK